MNQSVNEDTSGLWLEYMLRGDFEEVWKLKDIALAERAGKPCWHLPRHLQYVWDGSPLHGKRVLIRCYHGLGDSIQFIRYAPLVKAIAKEVIVWSQPALIPLFKTVQSIDHLIPLHEGTPQADYDEDVEIMELPHVFRTGLMSIPAETPYLHVDPRQLSSAKNQFNVGVVWKAGDWDERRSIPFHLLAPLFEIKGVTMYILQADAEAAGWRQGYGVHPGTFELTDYACVMKGMDLVISVDSMPVHLAGALGMPVWNLLHSQADWRWMKERPDSPWYPSMRLFRQQSPGDWAGVIKRVAGELGRVAASSQFRTVPVSL